MLNGEKMRKLTKAEVLKGCYSAYRPLEDFPYEMKIYNFDLPYGVVTKELNGLEPNAPVQEGDTECQFSLSVSYDMKKPEAVNWVSEVAKEWCDEKVTKGEISNAFRDNAF